RGGGARRGRGPGGRGGRGAGRGRAAVGRRSPPEGARGAGAVRAGLPARGPAKRRPIRRPLLDPTARRRTRDRPPAVEARGCGVAPRPRGAGGSTRATVGPGMAYVPLASDTPYHRLGRERILAIAERFYDAMDRTEPALAA